MNPVDNRKKASRSAPARNPAGTRGRPGPNKRAGASKNRLYNDSFGKDRLYNSPLPSAKGPAASNASSGDASSTGKSSMQHKKGSAFKDPAKLESQQHPCVQVAAPQLNSDRNTHIQEKSRYPGISSQETGLEIDLETDQVSDQEPFRSTNPTGSQSKPPIQEIPHPEDGTPDETGPDEERTGSDGHVRGQSKTPIQENIAAPDGVHDGPSPGTQVSDQDTSGDPVSADDYIENLIAAYIQDDPPASNEPVPDEPAPEDPVKIPQSVFKSPFLEQEAEYHRGLILDDVDKEISEDIIRLASDDFVTLSEDAVKENASVRQRRKKRPVHNGQKSARKPSYIKMKNHYSPDRQSHTLGENVYSSSYRFTVSDMIVAVTVTLIAAVLVCFVMFTVKEDRSARAKQTPVPEKGEIQLKTANYYMTMNARGWFVDPGTDSPYTTVNSKRTETVAVFNKDDLSASLCVTPVPAEEINTSDEISLCLPGYINASKVERSSKRVVGLLTKEQLTGLDENVKKCIQNNISTRIDEKSVSLHDEVTGDVYHVNAVVTTAFGEDYITGYCAEINGKTLYMKYEFQEPYALTFDNDAEIRMEPLYQSVWSDEKCEAMLKSLDYIDELKSIYKIMDENSRDLYSLFKSIKIRDTIPQGPQITL